MFPVSPQTWDFIRAGKMLCWGEQEVSTTKDAAADAFGLTAEIVRFLLCQQEEESWPSVTTVNSLWFDVLDTNLSVNQWAEHWTKTCLILLKFLALPDIFGEIWKYTCAFPCVRTWYFCLSSHFVGLSQPRQHWPKICCAVRPFQRFLGQTQLFHGSKN